MKFYIYSLSCPIENKIKYIGMSKDPKRRFYSHTAECHLNFIPNYKAYLNIEKIKWIKLLKSKKLKPILNIICEYDNKKDAMKKELELIKNIPDLLNSNILHYKKQ